MNLTSADFGEEFIWGVSTSAYQTEGAILEDGKGLSIWDMFCSNNDKVLYNQNATTACDFYNRYIQDIILMQYLNFKNFRFSISWPRLLPQGFGQVNQKGIDHYNRVIDFCLECGITPWVTLYHWDLPYALEQKGGWTNRSIIYWFSKYVELCVKKFGDRISNWIILNEPLAFTGTGYFLGIHAPGRKGLHNFLPAMHHAALCQSIGGGIIKSHNSQLKVGTTFSFSHIDAADSSERSFEAAKRVDVLLNRLFIEPLVGMGYPWDDLKILQQVQKYILPGDEEMLKCKMDFIGVQNYTREVVQYSPMIPYINAKIIKASLRNVSCTAMDWEIYPEGLYHILKKLHNYNNINNIIITENGAAFNDKIVSNSVQDPYRIQFLQRYLSQVLKAKKEGVNINGYFTWSLTDNFEWAEGFKQRFGLIYIDFKTQKRIIKSSGYWFRDFLQNMNMAKTGSHPSLTINS